MKSFVRHGIVIAAAGLFAGAAQAHGSVGWSVSIGTPGFGVYAPAPVYAAPAFVAPPAYYPAPPPAYYYGPPYAVAPAPVWVVPRHRPYRHWHRNEWRHRYR